MVACQLLTSELGNGPQSVGSATLLCLPQRAVPLLLGNYLALYNAKPHVEGTLLVIATMIAHVCLSHLSRGWIQGCRQAEKTAFKNISRLTQHITARLVFAAQTN